MGKKGQVQALFNNIAPTYDLLNHLLSMGIDKGWRRKAIRSISNRNRQKVLDVACGTGDFSLSALQNGVQTVIGIDLSKNMLQVAREKVQTKGIDASLLRFEEGDAEQLLFPDSYFSAVTVAFGVRNFEHLAKGLQEMYRVLQPEGEVVILEFSTPGRFPLKQLYGFYFKQILPTVGGWISGDKAAYRYLPDTVFAFPQGESFLALLRQAGFREVAQRRLTGGIASIYTGIK